MGGEYQSLTYPTKVLDMRMSVYSWQPGLFTAEINNGKVHPVTRGGVDRDIALPFH